MYRKVEARAVGSPFAQLRVSFAGQASRLRNRATKTGNSTECLVTILRKFWQLMFTMLLNKRPGLGLWPVATSGTAGAAEA